ncbi:hypothetical protein, partial [Neisseria sicca]|uniref:hypothetical protein n=1 Tax=Neisseria sicca TaxID=490 RepID=UPI001C99F99F
MFVKVKKKMGRMGEWEKGGLKIGKGGIGGWEMGMGIVLFLGNEEWEEGVLLVGDGEGEGGEGGDGGFGFGGGDGIEEKDRGLEKEVQRHDAELRHRAGK